MITPRSIVLCRAPDLAAFRTVLANRILALAPDAACDTCIVVPTRAAAEQLRRTVEDRAIAAGRRALLWPLLATRAELYETLAARLVRRPALLSAFEREVMLSSVARQLSQGGLELPFRLRPGLVAEMIALYDLVRRLGRTVETFERNIGSELEREQDTDRGAARLFQQTIFLAAAFRGYEARLSQMGAADEHELRARVVQEPSPVPLRHVIVTVADHVADADGLWPADLDLLARLPGLQRLELLATESLLAAGYLERLHAAFPDLDEERPAVPSRTPPVLVVPPHAGGGEAPLAFSYRDREEELLAVARRVKSARESPTSAPLHRTALVMRRPLPYLYLARDVFRDAGIAFETLDTLPLAAEPYAAAVDLALDAVGADFTRTTLVALLRSPHFRFVATRTSGAGPEAAETGTDDSRWSSEHGHDAIAACDVALAEARYLGGLDRLEALVRAWETRSAPSSREERRQQAAAPAARAILDAALALRPLAETRPMVDQIATLVDWLKRFDRAPAADDPTRSRRLRVRSAVFGALGALAAAYRRHDPEAAGDVADLTAALRRWLGGQTFASGTGEGGLQLVDAQAAKYGDFDDLQVIGVIDGDWPERVRRNVLYPASLLASLEPLPATADPYRREREALQSARAAFKDLVTSPSSVVRLSTIALENDAVVEPSILLDDVASWKLPMQQAAEPALRVSWSEALALPPRTADVVPVPAAAWGAMRLGPDARDPATLRGEAGAWRLPRVSVSRLELYLNCPFKFFADQVLRLEEQPEDEAIQTPLERGRFLHELWERFFAEWQRRGHARIDPAHLPDARALFTELCEEALARLSPSEAVLERQRLLGSAVKPGIAHRVFAFEADKPDAIVERLLEFPLEGRFEFRAADGTTRQVPINAKTDRIDVLEGGRLRVIDYKSKNTPDPKVALQLPVYAHLAREVLGASRGRKFSLAEALYVAFEGDRPVVPLRAARGQTLDDVVAEAQDRLIRTLDDIAAGRFPPRPLKRSLCGPCSYRAVCRLDIVTEDEAEGERVEAVETADV